MRVAFVGLVASAVCLGGCASVVRGSHDPWQHRTLLGTTDHQRHELPMPTNAALLDDVIQAAAFTAAGDVFDYGPLRRQIEARMAPGWRGIETCPDSGLMWVRCDAFDEPALCLAQGEQWRRHGREGRSAPTEWAPCEPPTWDERG